jgi:hypothetical protein
METNENAAQAADASAGEIDEKMYEPAAVKGVHRSTIRAERKSRRF